MYQQIPNELYIIRIKSKLIYNQNTICHVGRHNLTHLIAFLKSKINIKCIDEKCIEA